MKLGGNRRANKPRCGLFSRHYIGANFYANCDCIIIDVARVTIGANVFFGPRV